MADSKQLITLITEVEVLKSRHESLIKSTDSMYLVMSAIKEELSRLIKIEEKQLQIGDILSRIEKHASKQGGELEESKNNIHNMDLRLTKVEEKVGVNTQSRRDWAAILMKTLQGLIILWLGGLTYISKT